MNDARKKRYGGTIRNKQQDNDENRHVSNSSHAPNNKPCRTSRYVGHGGRRAANNQRVNSDDNVRKIVQEEGREARNLITWNVPIERTGRSMTRKDGANPSSASPVSPRKPTKSTDRDSYKSPKCEVRKKVDMRARYWAFMFDNIKRAVDAIYKTCEEDESVVECKEVIMMLDQSTRDFKNLIERLNVMKAYDEATKDGDRPTSIAWEVRKMSPGKTSRHVRDSSLSDLGAPTEGAAVSTGLPVQRALNFDADLPTQSNAPIKASSSWADMVKTSSPPLVSDSQNIEMKKSAEDSDGWEMVQRHKPRPLSANKQQSVRGSKTKSKNISQSLGSTRRRSNDEVAGTKRIKECKSWANVTEVHKVVSHDSEKENKPVKGELFAVSLLNSSDGCIRVTDITEAKDRGSTVCREIMSGNVGAVDNGQGVCEHDMDAISEVVDVACIKKTVGEVKHDLHVYSEKKIHDGVHEQQIVNGDASFNCEAGFPKGVEPVEILNGDHEDDDDNDDDQILTVEGVEMRPRTVASIATQIDEDDDSLETKHDKALATVLDHEDRICTELEKQQEEKLERVIREEATWLKELARERSKEIEVDESDVDITVGQTTVESSDISYADDSVVEAVEQADPVSWADMTDDDVYVPPFLLKSQSSNWTGLGDDDTERTPGHAVLMHEKLSSPSRKRSLMETKLRHEQKQAKAHELRQKLLQEKSENLRTISNKVDEVRSYKEELLLQHKITMDRKMKRAAEKRYLQLKQKALKAHEEEAKANEIAFINTLEAQNKRHDIITKHQESEARLHDLHEERQKRLEEKQAKEAAVEERRRALDAERAARLHEMQEKRKQRDARVEQLQIEREKERVETMRLKEKDKVDRLAALNAQQQAHIEELQRKIQQKQDDSHRRHQEVLADIQLKAFEMAVVKHSSEDHNDAPTATPYDQTKICTVCNILINSEVYLLSHIRGKRHQQSLQESCKGSSLSKLDIERFNLKSIVDAPHSSTHPNVVSEKERQKALKKRCKKLRARMVARGNEYENAVSGKSVVVESQNKAKFQKITKDINKFLQTEDRGPWPQNKVSALERWLGEISRIIEKKANNDQLAFRSLGSLTSLCRLLLVIADSSPSSPPVIPIKTLVAVCNVLRAVCKGCYDNCYYMLFNNKLGTLVDLLNHQMTIMLPDTPCTSEGPIPCDPIVTALMNTMSTILSCLAKNNPAVTCSEAAAERIGHTGDAFLNRCNDVISYIVCVGVTDKIYQYFSRVQGSINDLIQVGDLLHHSLGLLSSITRLLSMRNSNPFDGPSDDPTQLISTCQATELVGIVSLLYTMLLHSGAPARGQLPPPELPSHTVTVITTGIRTINMMAMLDLKMLQGVLGEEGTSLQFRHIASYLIWYCSQRSCEELLHEVIYAVGYFTVLNTDNQLVIQSGQPPTVLQQLCALPFHYFSDPRLTNILFPTIMSSCYRNDQNRVILEQELSGALIANFIEEKLLETKLTSSLTRKGGDKDKGRGDLDSKPSFMYRFPQNELEATIAYFTSE